MRRELGLYGQGPWLVLDSGVPGQYGDTPGVRGGAVEGQVPLPMPTAVCPAWAGCREWPWQEGAEGPPAMRH